MSIKADPNVFFGFAFIRFLSWLVQLVAVDVRLDGVLHFSPFSFVGYQFVDGDKVIFLQPSKRQTCFVFT